MCNQTTGTTTSISYGPMLKSHREGTMEEVQFLVGLLNRGLKADTEDLINEIVYGQLCELYEVEDEDVEDNEPEITLDEALQNAGSKFSDVHTKIIRVASLEDLLKVLSGE